ncbi:vWA domain-containing protein [Lysobacter sp. Hz 25]|uniref:vWA domain-containing protein n=1 Tax=Lysobacter sp. Hz 25 TaxID=3383698 RepID=UPI0038D43B05
MNQPVIPDVALVDNTEQRTPLVLVLDCSGSMLGEPVRQLNEGLKLLEQELKSDVIAAKRVRVLVVRYGGFDTAEVVGDWCDAMDFTAPTLEAEGTTPTGRAIELALAEVENEKQRFKQAGIAYTRPWLFLMSDGSPTDAWETAAKQARDAEQANKVAIFPIAVGEGSQDKAMAQFSSKGAAGVKRLQGLQFRELFLWLSASMQVVSQSRPGGQAQLPSTDTWSSVPT